MTVTEQTRAAIQELLRRFGWRLVPYRYTLRSRRIDLLREREVTLLVDVGANDGRWAHELRRAGYSGDILSLEPLTQPFARLKERTRRDQRWRCTQVAVVRAP